MCARRSSLIYYPLSFPSLTLPSLDLALRGFHSLGTQHECFLQKKNPPRKRHTLCVYEIVSMRYTMIAFDVYNFF